jgi:hypothetical protein
MAVKHKPLNGSHGWQGDEDRGSRMTVGERRVRGVMDA